MFALFPEFGARTRSQDLWPFLISKTGLKFLIWTQGKIHPGNRANPVNRAHMKDCYEYSVFSSILLVTVLYKQTQNKQPLDIKKKILKFHVILNDV